jgi:diguanylate cyclase
MKQAPFLPEHRRNASVPRRAAACTPIAELASARLEAVTAASPGYEDGLQRPDEPSGRVRGIAERLAASNARLRREVVELRREAAEARYYAYHDALTGLPNRALLVDRLEQAIVRAERQQKRVGLLFLDLDGFKSVNDRFGHGAGDQLLQQVAARLKASVRACDTACRYGGDEFVIMLPDVQRTADVNLIAHLIRDRIAAPYTIDSTVLAVTASVGVAIFDTADGQACSDMLRQADEAMYRAKRRRCSSARSA